MEIMPEPIVEQKVETPVAPVVETPKVEEDLLTRVAKFEKKAEEQKSSVPIEEDFKFDLNEINKIQDPAAKEYALKAYKSFQRGFNTKFQEVADLRKTLEQQINVEKNKGDSSNWSPEKVQSLLNNPDFVKAAQSVAGISNEEYSALSETEKAKLSNLEREITRLTNLNQQSLINQQDAQFKSKYANYDARAVDTLTSDMIAGKVQATREHLWRVLDYEPAVKRAYEMGRADERSGLNEKINSVSAGGYNVSPNETQVKREDGETSESFFQRLARKNLNRFATQQK
jgi:hypothetical protein